MLERESSDLPTMGCKKVNSFLHHAMYSRNVLSNMRIERGDDFSWFQVCHDFSVIKKHHAISEIQAPHPRSCVTRSTVLSIPLEILQHGLHLGAGQRIQRAEWLIHQKYWRIKCKRTSQANPLPLAARKLPGITLAELVEVEANHLDCLARTSVHLLFGRPSSSRARQHSARQSCVERDRSPG